MKRSVYPRPRRVLVLWLACALLAATAPAAPPAPALVAAAELQDTPTALKCRLFRQSALECGQWDRQRLPLQCSIFRIGTGCGRAEARPYHKKPTPESTPTALVSGEPIAGFTMLPQANPAITVLKRPVCRSTA